jgi:SAM-dependent methyltransferase
MRRAINKAVKLFSETFAPRGDVIEIGSYYMPGYEKLCDMRPYFNGQNYIGCDIRQGHGVERIEDAQALSFADKTIGTVLMFEILEHLPHPERAIMEARRVLRDDGILALSVPFNCCLHGFPSDYWRFTASGVNLLLSDFPDKIIFALGPAAKPAFIFAVASKSASREFAENKSLFQKRVQETFQRSRMRGYISVFKERGRDFFGHLLGRAELSATFFDPSTDGGYIKK